MQPAWEHRIATRNRDRIDPRDISAYVDECGGYSGLERAPETGPEGVIAELRESGLRGRGGAGYPTATKWQVCRDAEGDEKYAVCNAVDSDPRARTARLLLGSDPHSVLEGLLIGACAVGATRCFVCVNAEYGKRSPSCGSAGADERARVAGEDILGAGVSCDIEVERSSASFVAGEETALLRALEDRQALPYLRPAYPAVKGLYGRPTLIDSAETLANVSAILQGHPAAWRAPAPQRVWGRRWSPFGAGEQRPGEAPRFEPRPDGRDTVRHDHTRRPRADRWLRHGRSRCQSRAVRWSDRPVLRRRLSGYADHLRGHERGRLHHRLGHYPGVRQRHVRRCDGKGRHALPAGPVVRAMRGVPGGDPPVVGILDDIAEFRESPGTWICCSNWLRP